MPVISTNTAANTAVRYLNINSTEQSDSLSKLASGSNITKASDDAAGLAIATKISSDVAALEQASTNASHGISVLQTADGGASNIADIVERMKTLASQSASGTVTDTERTYIQAEFEQLQEEINGITESTRYNGQSLLDGSSDFSNDDIEEAASTTSTATYDTATLTGSADLSSGLSNSSGSSVNYNLAINLIDDDGATTSTLTIDFDIADGASMTSDEILTEINSDLNGAAVASLDASGNLVITTDSDVGAITATGGSLGIATATYTAGGTANASATTSNGYQSLSATEAETATITIDDIEITLTTTYEDGISTLSASDLVDQINEGLNEEGEYSIVAQLDSDNQLEIVSVATGENAKFTLADKTGDTGTLDLSNFGLTAGTVTGTTTEVATTGAEIIVGSTSADSINLSIDTLTTEALGIKDLDISTEEGAAQALSVLDTAIDTISNARAEIGATMSRFEFRSSQIDTSVENLEAAGSAISDVDIAKEQASLSSASVKVQAAVAAASQANEMPENLLSLIR